MPWKWRPKKPFFAYFAKPSAAGLFIFPYTQSRITYHFCLYIILQPWKGLGMLRGWWFRFLPILLKLYSFGIQNKIHHIFWQFGRFHGNCIEVEMIFQLWQKVQRVHQIFQQMRGFFCSDNKLFSRHQFYVTLISVIEHMRTLLLSDTKNSKCMTNAFSAEWNFYGTKIMHSWL